jgi:ABC-type branched-subunit amino acid transport system permease subunit
VFFVALRQYLLLNVGEYYLIFFGVLFILVVLFLPGGIVSLWSKLRNTLSRRTRENAEYLPSQN